MGRFASWKRIDLFIGRSLGGLGRSDVLREFHILGFAIVVAFDDGGRRSDWPEYHGHY
jgi:hypothetical protein